METSFLSAGEAVASYLVRRVGNFRKSLAREPVDGLTAGFCISLNASDAELSRFTGMTWIGGGAFVKCRPPEQAATTADGVMPSTAIAPEHPLLEYGPAIADLLPDSLMAAWSVERIAGRPAGPPASARQCGSRNTRLNLSAPLL